MMVSANNAQAILKKKERASSCYSFVMYEYVVLQQAQTQNSIEIHSVVSNM